MHEEVRKMIELRYPKVEDAEEYLRILEDGKYEFYHATIPKDVEEEVQWIKRREYKRSNNLEYNYSIICKGALVGGCKIEIFQQAPHIGELGYFINRNYFNKGIASEVVAKIEKIAFEDLKLIRLEIRMDPRNKASEKVAIKNNFIREGLLRKAVEFQGEYYDNLLYAKVR